MNRIKNELIIASCVCTRCKPRFTAHTHEVLYGGDSREGLLPLVLQRALWRSHGFCKPLPTSPVQERALRSRSLGNFITFAVASQQSLTQSK